MRSAAWSGWWPEATSARWPPSVRRHRRAHVALAVATRTVEAAGAAVAAGELVAGDVDALDPRLGLLARGDPVDPVASRHRRDVLPRRHRSGIGRERLAQVGRHLGFGFLLHRRD